MLLASWLEGGASLPRPLASVIFDPKRSYGLYESIHKTNLILPLPLSMLEFKKKRKMKRLIFVVDFFLPGCILTPNPQFYLVTYGLNVRTSAETAHVNLNYRLL
jgi:hypothetical protein